MNYFSLCGTAGVSLLLGACAHFSSSKFILIQKEPLSKVMFWRVVLLSKCLSLLEILKATSRNKTKIRISFPAPWASSLFPPPWRSTQLSISRAEGRGTFLLPERSTPLLILNQTLFQSIFLSAFLFSQCLQPRAEELHSCKCQSRWARWRNPLQTTSSSL